MIQRVFVNISAIIVILISQSVMPLEIVKRADWGAKPPKTIEYIGKPVPYVIIHHSYEPAACYTSDKCIQAMQSMQKFHQITRGWWDIGYTFGVGGDGKVYEGRGFNVIGAHAPKYNDKSIGICLIGDWQVELPPKNMLQAAQDLIAYAVEQGHLEQNFTIYGHRQVRDTTCPGGALFNEIQKWPNFGSETENSV